MPIGDLVSRHAIEGIYRLKKEFDEFHQKLGKAFERYTRQVLECLYDRVALVVSEQLKRLASGKSRDFLLELPDQINLIEAKSVAFIKTLLTTKPLRMTRPRARLPMP